MLLWFEVCGSLVSSNRITATVFIKSFTCVRKAGYILLLMNFGCNEAISQATDPGPRGGILGPCPQTKIVPLPKRGLCPKEIYRLGATGVQIEAQIGVFLDWHWISWRFWDEGLFFGDHLSSAGKSPAKSMKNFCFFWRSPVFGRKNRLNFRFRPEIPSQNWWRPISAGNSLAKLVKTFFFQRSPAFGRKNRLNFRFRPEIPSQNWWRPFFFRDHLLSAGKTAWISDFGRKIPLNLWYSPCLFYPDWDKFLVPPCFTRIHITFCAPQIFISAPPPPSHAILAPGLPSYHLN